MTTSPIMLSVVIAASDDADSLTHCLSSLEGQISAGDIEVIVASNVDGLTKKEIERQFPFAIYLGLPVDTTVPELRARGARHAVGEIIALIEDNCFVDAHWCEEIKKAHSQPYAAIGGAVVSGSHERPFDWAVYLSDYGKYMPPLQAGETDTLPGNNLSYKRSALERMKTACEDGIFEASLNEELKKRGQKLYLAPSVIVYHRKSYDPKETVIRYYYLARSYAGRRIAGVAMLTRLVFIAGSLLLPVLLPARIALRVLRKGHEKKSIIWSLPHLFLLMTSWSIGEFCGYVFGEGSSARAWR